ncbi:MAG: lysophospholipid acyltransferase family protein [Acidiphilium sp.]
MKLGHRIEAGLARFGIGLFRALGPVRASNLAGWVARTVGPFIPVSRVADRNLAMAMPELDAAARRLVVADVWENLGRTVAEMPLLDRFEETASGPGYTVIGREYLRAAAATGGASIVMTAHIGNWEIIPRVAAREGIRLGFMYRAASNAAVDEIILDLRRRSAEGDVPMFAKGAPGAASAYKYLARGGHLAMLSDQRLDNGIPVPLFGQMAMTAPAMATFALRFRCPVLPIRVLRIGPARLAFECEPPMALPDSGDREADIRALTTEMNRILERWIRDAPGSWLWLHRRWPKGQ